MTRTTRIIRNIAIGIGALLVLLIVSVLVVVHTDWFRNYVREKIIAATEDGTGGRVEIGSFNFDVSDLRAVVTNFVIHGTEPAGAPPFVQAARVAVDIRLFTSIHHLLDITFLGVQQPQVNVMVSADGRTNIPTPKTKSTSNKSALETVVDLAVGHFELTNGLATFNSKKQPLDVRANNLHAQLFYNVVGQSYQGKLSMEPLYVLSGRNTPVNFKVDVPVALHRDRIDIRNATISTPVSTISINGSMENMNSPKVSAHINGRVATIDLENVANLPLAVNAKNVPGELDLEANATASSDAIDVAGLRITLGKSNFEASGRLKDPSGNASLQFRSELAPGELGRLAKFTAPDTPVTLSGVAKLDAANNLDLTGLHVAAIGAEFDGSVSLANFQRYKVQGNLRNLDIQNAARLFHQKIPYDGVISGSVDAQGEKAVVAAAHFTISPGRRGIPVSGRINADYNSANDNIVV
ncbi:MAG TPA: hypothetical protein VHB50_10585, partial [Bryobacteraceae bacterium]|nr:hypothetical protein [Bryobacteraceae bacterium]